MPDTPASNAEGVVLNAQVSVNDFVVRAVALALAEVPQANSIWDAQNEEPKPVDSVDVAIAVATDKGLITPIIKAANTKSLTQAHTTPSLHTLHTFSI